MSRFRASGAKISGPSAARARSFRPGAREQVAGDGGGAQKPSGRPLAEPPPYERYAPVESLTTTHWRVRPHGEPHPNGEYTLHNNTMGASDWSEHRPFGRPELPVLEQ